MIRISFPIVFVSDMARSIVFYRDVLGLPLKFESPYWTEFTTGGAVDKCLKFPHAIEDFG